MITGYNHNVKYGDQVYHVQTEDSGVGNPHVITHLFVGGNIIETRKTSYADLLSSTPELEPRVVQIMQGQHKSMLKDLIRGSLDEKLAARSVNAAKLDGPAPLNVDAGQHRTSFGLPSGGAAQAPEQPLPPESVPPVAAEPTPDIPAELPTIPVPAPPPPLPERPADTDSDFMSSPVSSFFGDAPPPEQIIEAETLQRAFESKDDSALDSIFGEDLISEKSLDEVILSYLAEDMQKE